MDILTGLFIILLVLMIYRESQMSLKSLEIILKWMKAQEAINKEISLKLKKLQKLIK